MGLKRIVILPVPEGKVEWQGIGVEFESGKRRAVRLDTGSTPKQVATALIQFATEVLHCERER